jgi:predicted glycogen debranching enzyme
MIAGYHWFGEWGRDALISLPGLCLSTGRLSDATEILKTYSHARKNGLIPNLLSTNSEKMSYKSVDTSLLFIDRVYRVYRHIRNVKFIEQFWPVMKDIIENYINGTLYGIRMDNDGLITHGAGLTWMDVFLDGKYVTPREGKAVEIQALWYNALKIMEFFARKLNENWKKYSILSRKVKESFNEKFWNGSYLDDCLGDGTLRPNQIFAVGLSFSMLDEEKKRKVLSVVKKELMIKYGLRTLSKNDPRFHGKYSGNWKERDLSYHQGTAWPWLLGMFVRSWVRIRNDKGMIEKIVKPFVKEEIMRFGLGTISEIVDGDSPFESRGCISQAWSIGEILDCVTCVRSLSISSSRKSS